MDGTDVIAFAAGQALIDNIGAAQVGTTWTLKATSKSVWGNNTPVAGTTEPASAVTLKDSGSTNNAQVFMLKDKLTHLILPGKNDGRCYSAGKPIVNSSNNSINYSGAYCLAYIDVNGNKGPNQVIACDNQVDDGIMPTKFTLDINPGSCVLTSESITDVYPVIIYDDRIIPATPAAAAVLQDKY